MRPPSLLLRAALAVILIVLASDTSMAQRARPQVFSGSDLGRYFQRVWIPEYPYAAFKNRYPEGELIALTLSQAAR